MTLVLPNSSRATRDVNTVAISAGNVMVPNDVLMLSFVVVHLCDSQVHAKRNTWRWYWYGRNLDDMTAHMHAAGSAKKYACACIPYTIGADDVARRAYATKHGDLKPGSRAKQAECTRTALHVLRSTNLHYDPSFAEHLKHAWLCRPVRGCEQAEHRQAVLTPHHKDEGHAEGKQRAATHTAAEDARKWRKIAQ